MSDTMTIDGETVTRAPRLNYDKAALAPPGGDAKDGGPALSVGMESDAVPSQQTDTGAAPLPVQSELAPNAEALRARDEQIATLQRQREEDRSRLAALERTRQSDTHQRAQMYVQQVAGARDQAASDADRAWDAVLAARDGADPKAERNALENFNRAAARRDMAAGELQRVQQGGPPPGEAPQAQQGQYDPNVQAWIDAHPRYHSDTAYQAAAQSAAYEAERLGMKPNEKRYTDHVDKVLGARGFEGQRQENGGRDGMNGNGQQRGGGGAPPAGRGTGGGVSGTRINVPGLGAFTFRDGKDSGGRPHRFINFADKATQEAFAEFAEVNKMSVGEYANEFITIAREKAEGGDGGLQIGQEVVLR